jgi:hypothetical protein
MNQYYLEHRSKERIGQLQAEGLRSQAYYRSRPARAGLLKRLQEFVLSHLRSQGSQKQYPAKKPKSEAVYFEP